MSLVYTAMILLVTFYLDICIIVLCLYSNNSASYPLFRYVFLCFVYTVMILVVIFYLDMYYCALFI